MISFVLDGHLTEDVGKRSIEQASRFSLVTIVLNPLSGVLELKRQCAHRSRSSTPTTSLVAWSRLSDRSLGSDLSPDDPARHRAVNALTAAKSGIAAHIATLISRSAFLRFPFSRSRHRPWPVWRAVACPSYVGQARTPARESLLHCPLVAIELFQAYRGN